MVQTKNMDGVSYSERSRQHNVLPAQCVNVWKKKWKLIQSEGYCSAQNQHTRTSVCQITYTTSSKGALLLLVCIPNLYPNTGSHRWDVSERKIRNQHSRKCPSGILFGLTQAGSIQRIWFGLMQAGSMSREQHVLTLKRFLYAAHSVQTQ